MDRRIFIKGAAGTLLGLAAGDLSAVSAKTGTRNMKTTVSLIKTNDRISAIERAVDMLGINPVKGKDVLLKPNFNTADPFPASTHNDTLVALIGKIKRMGAGSITIGERCGPPDTADVIKEKGIDRICKEHGVGLINFEKLSADEWIRVNPAGNHWRNGFDVAKPVLDSQCIVSTCCLKTHRYGGVFTMSLKLSVGVTHKRNMGELHGSDRNMRRMIAEINQAYEPSLILMDGMEVFTDGGPMTGELQRADVVLAGTDRVAMDAVGLAVLKLLGSNDTIMRTKIFDQEQIARAVELQLGIRRPEQIEIITDDPKSADYAARLQEILLKG
jgi:uncharacterized protein (DUF362 family)